MDRIKILTISNETGLDLPYKLTINNDKNLVNMTKEIKKKLQDELLPDLKIFNNFYILFGINKKALGTYIYGSYYFPIMILNLTEIKRVCQEYNLSYSCGIETTILHELGHAIQDYYNIEFDEKEAEDFAVNYFNYGVVNKIGI